MHSEITRIQNSLASIQNGPAWHGPSLTEVLKDVDVKMASAYPINGCHSIWELVLHLIEWRIFCLKKIQNDTAYDIELNSHTDWPPVPSPTAKN